MRNVLISSGVLVDTDSQFSSPVAMPHGIEYAAPSAQDFDSISRIGDSGKREEAGKTGRFGIGFNSCYHLTDLPCFVSGAHLVMFDPHCR